MNHSHPEIIAEMSKVRRLEAAGAPADVIQAAYDRYWDVVDEIRHREELADQRYRRQLAAEAKFRREGRKR